MKPLTKETEKELWILKHIAEDVDRLVREGNWMRACSVLMVSLHSIARLTGCIAAEESRNIK